MSVCVDCAREKKSTERRNGGFIGERWGLETGGCAKFCFYRSDFFIFLIKHILFGQCVTQNIL